MTTPRYFDHSARGLRRARYSQGGAGYFEQLFADLLLERLAMVVRDFDRICVIGANRPLLASLRGRGKTLHVVEPSRERARRLGAEHREEGDLGLTAATFDLVLAAGTLDTVDDLPGALIQARRALVPDGLFVGALFAAPSLPVLRQCVACVEAERPQAVQRFHPLIDPRTGGDLLVRAGFALPVADVDSCTLSYRSLARLLHDLREAAATNVLIERRSVDRAWLDAVGSAFAAAGDEDRTVERFTICTLTGWSPAAGQPQPARRGSGRVSLATALSQADSAAAPSQVDGRPEASPASSARPD